MRRCVLMLLLLLWFCWLFCGVLRLWLLLLLCDGDVVGVVVAVCCCRCWLLLVVACCSLVADVSCMLMFGAAGVVRCVLLLL